MGDINTTQMAIETELEEIRNIKQLSKVDNIESRKNIK